MMLIFYIICGFSIFVLSGLIMHFNRLAIYRRRIIRHFQTKQNIVFILSKDQESIIRQCFLEALKIEVCIGRLEEQKNS